MSGSSDPKTNTGLANSLSNVFKLVSTVLVYTQIVLGLLNDMDMGKLYN